MNSPINITVLSDIVFNSVANEILKNTDHIKISFEYHEDLALKLLAFEPNDISKDSFLFLHSDQLFHRKPIDWQILYFESIIDVIKKYPWLKIIVSNSFSMSFELTEIQNSIGNAYDAFQKYHIQLTKLKGTDNVYFFDFQNIIFNIGLDNAYNYSLGLLYQMPYTKKLITKFANEIMSYLNFISYEEKKVIVLDCDNTLWNGIVGEDGIDNIFCDKNSKGLIFYHFQSFLKKRKEDGFLLCLCSKNNTNDVEEAFQRKNMPLKWDDFIIKKVNWNEKSQNISEISKELNLGEDSLIFIDDNNFEINIVREFTKVNSIFLFKNDYDFLLEITSQYTFRRKQILSDDKTKTNQYQVEVLRKEEKSRYNNIDDFVESLSIKMKIFLNDHSDINRLSQMTEKTNQFNFNKKPFTKQQLETWMNTNLVYSLKVSDKYGDYGTVGLMLISVEEKKATIENYLLSCRVLGKKIEQKFLLTIEDYLLQNGIIINKIYFKESEKNLPAKTFIKETKYGSIVKQIK